MADATCRECGETKPPDAFKVRDGKLTTWCRACARRYLRAWKRAHRPPPQPPVTPLTQSERSRNYNQSDKGRAARARWRAANQERERRTRQAWKERNRLLVNEYDQRRRFAESCREALDPVAIGERDGWWCYLCESTVEPAEATLDHVIPLVRGGTHTADNVAIAHLRCNQEKGERWLGDFLGFVEPGRVRRATYDTMSPTLILHG
jgi:5-methylcytosine-specific restriction endonuclease McrA